MNSLDELFPPPKAYHRGRVARLKHLKPLTSYQKAKSVVRKDPEVVLKIGAANIKNFKHLQQACDYIARNGILEVQDQEGNIFESKEEYRSVLDSWNDKQGIPERNDRFAHAKRIILSMPVGTDHHGFKRACTQWAKDSLDGYDYLMAYHLDGEDSRSQQPHCHILIRAVGKDGKRLHISNEERQLMREHFAQCLNKEGIQATATRRWSRLQENKGITQDQYHARKRTKTAKERARDHAIARKKKHLQEQRAKSLDIAKKVVMDLSNSEYQDDHKMASALANFYRDKTYQAPKELIQKIEERER